MSESESEVIISHHKLNRSYSDKYIDGAGDADLLTNRNANWVTGRFMKVTYILGVAIFFIAFHISQALSVADCWTATNMLHGVTTFSLFHWVKGAPDVTSQGEYDNFTLYEQIDVGVPYTHTKKFLMLMPALLTLASCHYANYKPIYVIVNVGIMFILIIAKLPEMHRVRIMGINSSDFKDAPVKIHPVKGSKEQ